MKPAQQLMHENDVVIHFGTREEAHGAAMRAYAVGRQLVGMNPDKTYRMVIGEDPNPITIKQRGFLHVAVFPQIEEQYRHPDGTRSEWRVWKEYFRARFLGVRWVMKRIPRWDPDTGRMVLPKRATPHRERVSTEDLSVKQYSEYIDTVIDTATLEMGVRFVFDAQERDAVRYRKPVRRQKEAVVA